MKKIIILALLTLFTNPNLLHANKLHDAAKLGNLELVYLHLHLGVDSRNDFDQTPLHLAAMFGHAAVVAKLLNIEDINPHAQDIWGNTPIRYAIRKNYHKIVTQLINRRRGTKLLFPPDNKKNTLIHCAARHNALASAVMLLDSLGKEMAQNYVNAPNNSKTYPLHLAAQQGHNEMIGLLIASGARVDVRDKLGNTPLHYAIRKGHLAGVIQLIDKHKANVNILDIDGKSPSHEEKHEAKTPAETSKPAKQRENVAHLYLVAKALANLTIDDNDEQNTNEK